MTYVRLFVLLILLSLGRAGAAQPSGPPVPQLLPPPGIDSAAFRARPAYYQGERLRLRLPAEAHALVVRSDLQPAAGEYTLTPGHYDRYTEANQAGYRRRCWLLFWQKKYTHVPRPRQALKSSPNLTCDLEAFPQAGLHQLQLQVRGPAGDFPPVVYHLFAYSGRSAAYRDSESVLRAPTLDDDRQRQVRQAGSRLADCLRLAREDALAARWDMLLAEHLQQRRQAGRLPYGITSNAMAGCQLALVFAPEHPLIVLVLDEKLQPLTGPLRQELCAFLEDVLTLVLDPLRDPALLQPGATALSAEEATAYKTMLAGLICPVSVGPVVYDAGFVEQALLQTSVPVALPASTLRMRLVQQHFSQVQVILRLPGNRSL